MAVQRVQCPVSFQYLNGTGVLIPIPVGTDLTIIDRNTGNPATVYAAFTGNSTIISPATDAGGNVPGYYIEGSYAITAAADLGASPPYSGSTINWEAVRGDGVENIFPGAVTTAAIASGAITLATLAAAVAQALVPTGTILDYGGNAAPAGYHLCDGSQQAQVGTFAALYAVIGNTYNTGGEGVGNFRLPDTRQRFSLGKASSGTGSVLGARGGLIGHTHSIPALSIPALGVGELSIPDLALFASAAAHSHTLSSNGGVLLQLAYGGGLTSLAYSSSCNIPFSVAHIATWPTPNLAGAGTINGHALYGATDGASASVSGVALGQSVGAVTGSGFTSVGNTGTGTSGASDPPFLTVNKIIKL